MLQLFADKEVLFAGQPVGIIVAQTQELADQAAELVIIKLTDKKKPVLDIRQVVKDKDLSRIILITTKPPIPKRNCRCRYIKLYKPWFLKIFSLCIFHLKGWYVQGCSSFTVIN